MIQRKHIDHAELLELGKMLLLLVKRQQIELQLFQRTHNKRRKSKNYREHPDSIFTSLGSSLALRAPRHTLKIAGQRLCLLGNTANPHL